MNDAKVLVVDDSAAMRALFCDVLEQAKGVQVVGTAANADEARDQIALLHPNVITLDVEMPGAAVAANAAEKELALEDLGEAILATCNQA